MDFVTHLPRTSQEHDAVWVIVDRLTKSSYFLAVRMTFTLEEFYMLYIRKIFRLHGVPVSSIGSRSQVYDSFLEEFPESRRDTIDDEHCFSSLNGQSIGEDHPNFRGHATTMRSKSQGQPGRAFTLSGVRLQQ